MDEFINEYKGKEVPRSAVKKYDENCIQCFKDSFYSGKIAKKVPGCVFGDIILYTTCVIIFCLIFVKFLLALFYAYYQKRRRSEVRGNTPMILQVTCYSEGECGLRSTLELSNKDRL